MCLGSLSSQTSSFLSGAHSCSPLSTESPDFLFVSHLSSFATLSLSLGLVWHFMKGVFTSQLSTDKYTESLPLCPLHRALALLRFNFRSRCQSLVRNPCQSVGSYDPVIATETREDARQDTGENVQWASHQKWQFFCLCSKGKTAFNRHSQGSPSRTVLTERGWNSWGRHSAMKTGPLG